MSRFLPKVKHISNDLHLGLLSLDKHLDCLKILYPWQCYTSCSHTYTVVCAGKNVLDLYSSPFQSRGICFTSIKRQYAVLQKIIFPIPVFCIFVECKCFTSSKKNLN